MDINGSGKQLHISRRKGGTGDSGVVQEKWSNKRSLQQNAGELAGMHISLF